MNIMNCGITYLKQLVVAVVIKLRQFLHVTPVLSVGECYVENVEQDVPITENEPYPFVQCPAVHKYSGLQCVRQYDTRENEPPWLYCRATDHITIVQKYLGNGRYWDSYATFPDSQAVYPGENLEV